jgi:hypothetical protein
MSRADQIRESIDALNAHDYTSAGKDFADNVKFHAPGLGLDVEGRETVMEHVSQFVEQADVRYEVREVVEHVPFVVTFAGATGTLDGQRKAWDLCQVLRYEDDQIAEAWVLRGSPPQPISD